MIDNYNKINVKKFKNTIASIVKELAKVRLKNHS